MPNRRDRRRCLWPVYAAIAAAVVGPMTYGKTRQVTWRSAVSGTWDVGANWSTSPAYPNNGTPNNTDYTVLIGAAGPAYTVTLDTDVSVTSLTLNSTAATLSQTAGTLTVPTLSLLSGTYALAGGATLRSATVTGPGSFVVNPGFASATLDAVTLGSSLAVADLPAGSAGGLRILNGLTLSGGATVSLGSTPVDFSGAQSLTGTGTVAFDGVSAGGGPYAAGGGTLTIGAGIHVQTGAQSGVVAARAGGTVANYGTLSSNVAGRGLSLLGPVTNFGTVEASNGGSLTLSRVDNRSAVHVGAGSALTLTDDWSSSGPIDLDAGATAELSGRFTTASLRTVHRAAGAGNVFISGSVDNSGDTFVADALTGAWPFAPSPSLPYTGEIHGGTITAVDPVAGLAIPTSGGGGFFPIRSLAIDTNLTTAASLSTSGDITINAGRRVTLDGSALLIGAGSRLLGGGEIVFGNASSAGAVLANDSVTIGPALTLRTGAGSGQILGLQGPPGATLFLQGLVSAQSPGRHIDVEGRWSNTGTFEATNGGILNLFGTTDSLGTLRSSGGGAIILNGVDYNNAGKTLALSAATGNLLLRSYADTQDHVTTIHGGTITSADNAVLEVGSGSGPATPDAALDAVTLGAAVSVTGTGQLQVTNGLTFNSGRVSLTGALAQANMTGLRAQSTQTWGGTGEIVFDGITNFSLLQPVTGTLTIGPGVTVRTGTGGGAVGNLSDPSTLLVNQGTISARTSGKSITVWGNWVNQGTFEADGSTLYLLGDVTSDALGTLRTRNFGRITYGGALDNTGRTLTLTDSTGNLEIYAGATGAPSTVTGGSLATTGSARFLLTNLTLDGVTLDGSATVSGLATVHNNLTVNGSLMIDAGRTLDLPGAQSILGTGTIGGGVGSNPQITGGTLTIGPSVTLRPKTPWGVNSSLEVSTTDTLINLGTLSADGFGSNLYLTGAVDNRATIEAVNEGLVLIDSPAPDRFSNTGSIRVTPGSRLYLRGSYSADRLGHIENTGKFFFDGTLYNPGTFLIDDYLGTVTLDGVIRGGTIATSGAGALVPTAATLYGVTLGSDFVFGPASSSNPSAFVSVYDGLTVLAGRSLTLGQASTLTVNASPSPVGGADLSGGGEIILDHYTSQITGPSTFTTAPSLTIHTGPTGGGGLNNLSNAGTVLAEAPGGTLYLRGAWTNSGVLRATNGGTLDLGGIWSNAGTIVVDPASTVVIGGTVTTAGLGTIQWNGGTATIAGSLDNTGGTFALSPATGSVILGNVFATAPKATITGGTVTTSGGAFLDVAYNSVLANVQFNGDASVRPGVTLQLNNPQPATAPGRITLNNGTLDVLGTLAGPVEVVLDGDPNSATLDTIGASTGTMTLGPGVTIRTGTNDGRISFDKPFVNQGALLAQLPGGTLEVYQPTNQGLIRATAGATAAVSNFTNAASGTIAADHGGTLALSGSWTNAGTLSIDAATISIAPGGTWTNAGTISVTNGSTFAPAGTWTNTGTISLADSNLLFSSLVPSAVGAITAERSTITVATQMTTAQIAPLTTGANALTVSSGGGRIENTGATLDLADTAGLTLSGGAITGGTIASPAGGPGITVASSTAGSSLVGVIVSAPVAAAAGGTLSLVNSTLNAPATFAAGSRLFLLGNWSNTATLSVDSGALSVPATGSNTGTLTLTNVNLTFSSFANIGTVSRSGGTATFTGIVDNADATFDPNATSLGPVVLGPRARINGGTLASAAPILVQPTAQVPATFDAVTVASDVTVSLASVKDQSAVLNTVNGLTVASDATLTMGSFTTLRPSGSQTYAGPGTIYLNGGRIDFTGAQVTFAPGLTVRSGPLAAPSVSGSIAVISFRTSSIGGTASLVNDGTISAETPGKTVLISGPTLTNNGTLRATNGSTLSLASPSMLTNYTSATGTLTGGTYEVDDNSTLLVPYNAAVPIMASAATIHLAGPNSSFPSLNALANNAGSLTLTNGRAFATQGPLTNTGSITLGPAAALKVAGTLTNTGTITLAGGTLLIDYADTSPIDDLRHQLLDGRLATSLPGTAVAYFDAAQLGLSIYAGLPVDATTLLAKVTVAGDANLDGRIGPDDYALLDRSYARSFPDPHWTDGDFDYDGVITPADYLLIDRSLGSQTGALSPDLLARREAQFGPGYVGELGASVPEPSLVISALMIGTIVRARRRRRWHA